MDAASESAFQRLRLQQLALVCLLSETGSLRRAAERLHATPPAVSKSLREVERVAGTALFTRMPQGMRMTPAGEAFAQQARAILQRLPALRESLREGSGKSTGALLRIGTAPFIAWQLLPPALGQLAAKGALPRLQFVEARILALAEQLVHGDLDAILTLITPEAAEALGRVPVVLEQVRVERLLVVGAPGHPSRRRSWRQLAAEPWILPPTSYSARLMVQRAFLEAGVVPPEPRFESINIPAMLALARQGLGITPAFESTVRDDLARGSLRRIRLEGELGSLPIGLAYRPGAAELAAIRALRDALRAEAA